MLLSSIFFFKEEAAKEIMPSLLGFEIVIRDRLITLVRLKAFLTREKLQGQKA